MSLTLTYWFLCVIILWLKMFANSIVQGIYRVRHQSYTRPDDAAFFGRGAAPLAADIPIVQRASGCWRNDLENIPMFLIIGLGFALADGPASAASIYFGLFTIFRIAHTITYLHPVQPWRHLAYQAGTFVTLALIVHTLVLVFT